MYSGPDRGPNEGKLSFFNVSCLSGYIKFPNIPCIENVTADKEVESDPSHMEMFGSLLLKSDNHNFKGAHHKLFTIYSNL